MNLTSSFRLSGAFLLLFLLLSARADGQTNDTLSNWEDISPAWQSWAGDSGLALNPQPQEPNLSEHCFRFTTTPNAYDLMLLDLAEAVDFETHPLYAVSVLAPETGGNLLLKFENSDVSASQEIQLNAVAGQWTRLVFNFSGLVADDLTRIVLFPDFMGTAGDQLWYIDDIVRLASEPTDFQSNLPIIVINTNGQTITDDPKITAQMGIIDNGPGQINHLNDPWNNYDGLIGIEIRGQSSQMFPKKSYGFETRMASGENLDVSLLNLPPDNDWVLYAPYSDKSLMRNFISYEMSRRTGEYATRSRFVEVVINDDYRGLYMLLEKIKKGDDRVDIATLKPDETEGDDLSGGYILSVDKLPWDFSYATDGWKSDPDPPYPNAMDIIFQYYYPKADEIVNTQRSYIKNWITLAENTLTGPNFKNPIAGYQKYFDVPSFVQFMIICEIAKEVDKYRYSTYLFKEKDSDGGKLHAGPAWDFDLGYGNVDYWQPGLVYTDWLFEMVAEHSYSIMFWWKRLMEDDYFKNLTYTRYHELRQTVLSDSALHASLDSAVNLTAEARLRNFDRWPILGQYVWPNYDWQGNDYDDELRYFSNFLFNRLHYMDVLLPGKILRPYVHIDPAPDRIRLQLNDDYFRTTKPGLSAFVLHDAPQGLALTGVNYITPDRCELLVSGNPSEAPLLSVTVKEKALNGFHDLSSNQIGYTGLAEQEQCKPEVYFHQGKLMINLPPQTPMPAYAEVTDVTGRIKKVFSLEKGSNALSEKWSQGLYILVFRAENQIFTKKLIFTSEN